MFGVASPAFGQLYADEDDNPAGFISVTTTSTGLVGGAVTMIVSLIKNRNRDVQAYLKQNSIAVRRDIFLGAGTSVGELAFLMNLDPKKLGHAMRKDRMAVAKLVHPEHLDTRQTQRFIEWATTVTQ